jgi:hypothetical protein
MFIHQRVLHIGNEKAYLSLDHRSKTVGIIFVYYGKKRRIFSDNLGNFGENLHTKSSYFTNILKNKLNVTM